MGLYPLFSDRSELLDLNRGHFSIIQANVLTHIDLKNIAFPFFSQPYLYLPTFSNWGAGEPSDDSGGDDCVELKDDGYWSDTQCTLSVPFICERSNGMFSRVTRHFLLQQMLQAYFVNSKGFKG